jgi:hypothetical protein
MQTLPLVLSTCLILSLILSNILTFALQQQYLDERILKQLTIQEQIHSKSIEIFLESKEPKVNKPAENTSKSKKKKGFHSRRIEQYFHINSKLLIKELFEKKSDDLKQLALNYLTRLYPPSQGFDAVALLDEILEKGFHLLEDTPTLTSFDLYDLKNPSFQLKKAIEGTKGYVYKKSAGYPSLVDVIEIFPKNGRDPVCASYANIALLEALFGEEGAMLIMQEESSRFDAEQGIKQVYLNKNEMIELFQKERLPVSTALLNLLGDKRIQKDRSSKKQIVILDPSQNLEARGWLHKYPLKGMTPSKKTAS